MRKHIEDLEREMARLEGEVREKKRRRLAEVDRDAALQIRAVCEAFGMSQPQPQPPPA
jgi:phage host-nuclease inhibitor protein Gam